MRWKRGCAWRWWGADVALSCTTVEWRGLSLTSADLGPFGVARVAGWDELPGSVYAPSKRPRSHGRFAESPWADERIVTVTGQIVSRDRDELLERLLSVMTWPSGDHAPEPLTITRAGRTLTADAFLTEFRTPTDADWSVGKVPFAIEWRCPDPLRYGLLVSVSSGFPELVGGLAYPLYTDGAGTVLGWLDYGPPSTTGTVSLTNEGTADAHPQFEVTGPAPGFEVVRVGTGDRLVFDDPIPAGSRFVVDTASGVAVMDGVSDRTLTWQDPMTVGPGETAEFAFVPRGESTAAVLRASLRPAYW